MPIDILMPALSPTMEKGNLAKWLKKEGDAVKSGDVLAEIETDKATMEVEAVDEGVLGKILIAEGTSDVPVNQAIAILLEEGEDKSALANRKDAPKPQPVASAGQPASQPQAQALAVGTKTDDEIRVFASPLARRVAKDAGLDLGKVQGTGPHGRIVKADVDAAQSKGSAPAQMPAISGAGVQPMADDKIRALFKEGSYDVVPHDSMRKIIAKRLLESKLTVPHFYLSMDVDLENLLRLREELNAAAPTHAEGKPGFKLSVNDFVIKAMARALIAVPDANATWTETGMLKHRSADVGVAVAIPNGLITPVIRDAHIKTLSAISAEMKDLAARAKAKKLMPEEYQGGTTAISNLGMFGVKEFAAIISPPHATILAVGAGEKRAVIKDGQLAVASQMTVTLSTDHRAVDGALGAELLAAFKGFIEKPMAMLV
jgi:pyruvate dehydrogenase E2 component (dihydrolipoamide acetyltransferase)